MESATQSGGGSQGTLTMERTDRVASASIRALLPTLVPSEARVATLFLDQPGEIIHLSVTEMAALAGTSASTVVRCCQRLGFQGFQDLKIALAQEALPAVARLQGAVEEGDPPATVLAKVVEAGADAIRSAVATVAPGAFERAIGALGAAGRVLVVGVGARTDRPGRCLSLRDDRATG